MRRRPGPRQLAAGAVALGLAVFLSGVTAAWQASARPDPQQLATGLSPEPPPAEGAVEARLEAVPAEVPTSLAADLTTSAPAAPPTTLAPPTTAPPTSPAAAPPTTARRARVAAKAAAVAPGLSASTGPFSGMGTWVDVFDWSPTYAKGRPVKLAPGAVDAMADQGVQVLYLQTTRADYAGPGDIVDPAVLQQWLARAQARGLRVVAWYLPTLTDIGADVRRLRATAALGTVDGIGVDIESKAVADHDERSRRLVELSRQARAALAGRPLSAITLPNVVTDVINVNYWPRFPWAQIRPFYDVWQPMSYWTNRTSASPYRNAELYTRENVERMRAMLGDPNAVVSPIGGIGDATTPADVDGYLRAVRQTRSIGASLYDWSTQSASSYGPMRAARA
ncbi:MAG: hypothetical protein ABIS47_07265 [Acidimicrobiales bacterium]